MTGFSCPLCDGAHFKILDTQIDWLVRAEKSHDERKLIGAIVARDPALSFEAIVRCSGCGLATVKTPPTSGALGGFYSAYYASASYGSKRDKKIKRAAKRVRRLARGIKSEHSKVGKMRFLDVGANLGYAVEGARLQGFDATGIEIDGSAVTKAQTDFPENTYIETTVEAFAARGDQFDLVYCSEVLEHAVDIWAFAAALMDLVAPGGVLFVTTPADGHRATPHPLVSWVQVKPPEHLHWFAKDHMLTLFARSGFTPGFQFNSKPGHKMRLNRDI